MAALSDKISWYIDLNASSALRGFKDVADAADKQLGKASKKIGEFEKSAAKSGTGKLDGLAATANGALSKLGVNAELTGAQLSGGLAVGAAAAGTAILAFAASSVQAYQSLAQEVLKVQRVTGATAQDSSRLVQVLDDYQISGEAAAGSFSKLNKALAAGSLAKFGIEAAKNADGTTNFVQSLERVADAYNATNDPATRAALGSAAFGKSYQSLIPIIEQGGTKLAAALKGVNGRLVLNQEDVDRAEKLRLAMENLGDTILGLKVKVGEGLIGPLIVAAGWAEKVSDALDRAESVGAKIPSWTALIPVVGPFIPVSVKGDDADRATLMNKILEEQRTKAQAVADAVEDQYGSLAKMTEPATIVAKAMAADAAASSTAAEASKVQQSALEARAKAADDYQDKVTALNRAREDGPSQIAAAERSYASALRQSADAADRSTEAQVKLERARRESSTGLTAAKAELAVLEAQQRLSLAQERASVRRSPLDDQSAKVDALQAQIDLEDAVAARNNLAAGKDPNLIGAQRDVADAAAAKDEADAAAKDAKKSSERTKQDVQAGIDEAQDAVTKAYKDFEQADNDFLAAMIANADAAANALKTPAERYLEFLGAAVDERNKILADVQVLKDRGLGDLADELIKIGPEGFAVMDSFVDTSNAKLAEIQTRVDNANASLAAFKAQAVAAATDPSKVPDNATATQSRIFEDIANYVNRGVGSGGGGGGGGPGRSFPIPGSSLVAGQAPQITNIYNTTVNAGSADIDSAELAQTLAWVGGNR